MPKYDLSSYKAISEAASAASEYASNEYDQNSYNTAWLHGYARALNDVKEQLQAREKLVNLVLDYLNDHHDSSELYEMLHNGMELSHEEISDLGFELPACEEPEIGGDCISTDDSASKALPEEKTPDIASAAAKMPAVDRSRFTGNTNAVLCFDVINDIRVVCIDLCYDCDDSLPEADVDCIFQQPATDANIAAARNILNHLQEEYRILVWGEALAAPKDVDSLNEQIISATSRAAFSGSSSPDKARESDPER